MLTVKSLHGSHTMGFLERRAEQFRLSVDGPSRPSDRYGQKPGARNHGSNDPLHARRPVPAPVSEDRPELTELLGRTVLQARTQQICRDYGLIPRTGPDTGSGLSRSYLARDAGVEIAADTHGTIITVFLHFHGDDGFTSYRGEIPGGAGDVPRRAALWAALGRPASSGDPYRDPFLGDYGPWDRWTLTTCTLHAQYALDGENLHRVTLTLPDPDLLEAA
jgi:hypothetical protein